MRDKRNLNSKERKIRVRMMMSMLPLIVREDALRESTQASAIDIVSDDTTRNISRQVCFSLSFRPNMIDSNQGMSCHIYGLSSFSSSRVRLSSVRDELLTGTAEGTDYSCSGILRCANPRSLASERATVRMSQISISTNSHVAVAVPST